MASVNGIANRALQRLGAARISDITDATNKSARACNAAYEPTRLMLLRQHPWSFSIKRAQLAASITAPPFDYVNYFPWPTDALRILPPTEYGLDWQMEGRNIVTNFVAPLNVRYVADVVDPNAMDSLFREVLSAQIAYDICDEITQSNTKKQLMRDDRDLLIATAKNTNAIEKLSDEIPDDTWLTVRL